MKRVLFLALGLFVVLGTLLQGCGGGDTDVGVKVGSIATAVSARAEKRAYPDDAVQSSTAYAYAKVDGIKLNLLRLQAIKGSNETTIVDFGSGKEVIIAPGSDNNVPITETASVDSGTYDGLKVRYDNSYKVKAYCRTATKFVYTTAAGITAIPVASAGTSAPSDYDYYAYPFAAVTVATSATGGNPETMEQTDGSYTITKGQAVEMAVLFDPSYLVTCYDGSTGAANGTNNLNPFGWTNNNGVAASAFFPDSQPNFGMGYVPIFVWLSQSTGEALPTAETYAASSNSANLAGNIDYNNVAVTSFAFRADGSIMAARARISSGGSSGDIQQFFSGFETTSRATYSMKNGEWQCTGADYSGCGPIQDRAITGFQRTSDYTSTSSSVYTDGPDCGKSCIDPNHTDWGNRCRACGATGNMHWRKIYR